jgi:hypothetical protein
MQITTTKFIGSYGFQQIADDLFFIWIFYKAVLPLISYKHMLLSIARLAKMLVSDGLNFSLVTVSTPHSKTCSGLDLSYDQT